MHYTKRIELIQVTARALAVTELEIKTISAGEPGHIGLTVFQCDADQKKTFRWADPDTVDADSCDSTTDAGDELITEAIRNAALTALKAKRARLETELKAAVNSLDPNIQN